MERHDPPRILAADAPAPGPAPPAARRIAAGRLGRAALVLASVAGLLVVGGSSVSRSITAWLHRREEYGVRFVDIALEPPPPPWIKGGRTALLESVRAGRAHLETVSILDIDLDRLLTDVRRNPWVARADRASKSYPNGLAVSLSYREPVALVAPARRGPGPPTPVDRDGVALPPEEFDASKAGPLATIAAEAPATPPRPGLAWPGTDSRVARAARLAGHLKDALRAVGPTEWRPESISVLVHDPKIPYLWVEFDRTPVLWGRYDALDAPGEPSDLDKWRALAAKAGADGGLKPLAKDEYLDARDPSRIRKTPRSPDH